jgi:hypothetical protein
MNQNELLTSLYHITPISNLSSIIQAGGLYSDSQIRQRKLMNKNIAYSQLKDRRANKKLSIGRGETLADYVPFYFSNRSPMLYAIHTKQVHGYKGNQDEIIYLITDIQSVLSRNIEFCFSDGHAVEAITSFFNDINDLNRIDWKVIDAWSWKDTLEDSDKKRRKQAEFLIYNFSPWSLIKAIGVMSENIKKQIEIIISKSDHQPLIKIEPKWYY